MLGLVMYVVCFNPADAPGLFTVRRWYGEDADPAWGYSADTLETIRKSIPAGLYRQVRYPDDDPVIIEVWF